MQTLTVLFVVALVASAAAGPRRLNWSPLEPFNGQHQAPEGLIVGGSAADINNFRYQLSLRYGNSHICGASAISDRFALSAAHCIVTFSVGNWRIFGGSASRSDDAGGRVLTVSAIHEHPNWNENNFNNDVALFETSGLLSSSLIQAIPLGGSRPSDGSTVTVSGWGVTYYGSSNVPENLLYVNVPVVNWNTCNSNHGGSLTENQFCASEAGRDACQGDSGGPLVQNGQQYGIVSFGTDCADARWPGVYTDVSAASVRNWIRQVSGV